MPVSGFCFYIYFAVLKLQCFPLVRERGRERERGGVGDEKEGEEMERKVGAV